MNKEERDAMYAKKLKLDEGRTDREIIEEIAVVKWIDPTKPTRQIIYELMAYSAAIALDPSVSQAAVDLYLQGYQDGKDQALRRY